MTRTGYAQLFDLSSKRSSGVAFHCDLSGYPVRSVSPADFLFFFPFLSVRDVIYKVSVDYLVDSDHRGLSRSRKVTRF